MSKYAKDQPFLFIRHQLLIGKTSRFDFLCKTLIKDCVSQFSIEKGLIASPLLSIVYSIHIAIQTLYIQSSFKLSTTFQNFFCSIRKTIQKVLVQNILSHQTLQNLFSFQGLCLVKHMVLTIPVIFSTTQLPISQKVEIKLSVFISIILILDYSFCLIIKYFDHVWFERKGDFCKYFANALNFIA